MTTTSSNTIYAYPNKPKLNQALVDGSQLISEYASIMSHNSNLAYSTIPSDHKVSSPSLDVEVRPLHFTFLKLLNKEVSGYVTSMRSFKSKDVDEVRQHFSLVIGLQDGRLVILKKTIQNELVPKFTVLGTNYGSITDIQVAATTGEKLITNWESAAEAVVGMTENSNLNSNLAFVATAQGAILKVDLEDGRVLLTCPPTSPPFPINNLEVIRLDNQVNYVLVKAWNRLTIHSCLDFQLVCDILNTTDFTKAVAIPNCAQENIKLILVKEENGKTKNITLAIAQLSQKSKVDLDLDIKISLQMVLPDFVQLQGLDVQPVTGINRPNSWIVLVVAKHSFALVTLTSDKFKVVSSLVGLPGKPKFNDQFAPFHTTNSDDSWESGRILPSYLLLLTTTQGFTHRFVYDLEGNLTKDGDLHNTVQFENKDVIMEKGSLTDLFVNKEQINLIKLARVKEQTNSSWWYRLVCYDVKAKAKLTDDPFPNQQFIDIKNWLPKSTNGSVTNQTGEPTALIPVTLGYGSTGQDWLAQGYTNGSIVLKPTKQLFKASTPDEESVNHEVRQLLLGHQRAITTLYEPIPTRNNTKVYLLSGDRQGVVKLWELSSRVTLATFTNHNAPITHIFQLPLPSLTNEKGNITKVPLQIENKVNRLVFSVANDNSLSVLCLKRMVTLGSTPGHPYQVTKIQLRVTQPPDLLVITYADATSQVYQLTDTSLLVVKPNTVDLTKAVFDCGLIRQQVGFKPNPNATLSSFPLVDGSHNLIAQAYVINLRRLLEDLKSNANPSLHFLSDWVPTDGKADPNKRDRVAYSSASLLRGVDHANPPLATNSTIQCITQDIYKVLLNQDVPDELLSSLFRLENGATEFDDQVRVAVQGDGYFSLSLGTNDLLSSNTHTANRLLSTLTLAKSLASTATVKSKDKSFNTLNIDLSGTSYQPPSLSFLVQLLNDPNLQIQNVGRYLLDTFHNSSLYLEACIQYLTPYIPTHFPVDLVYDEFSIYATLTLTYILAKRPASVETKSIRQSLALTLLWLISPHTKNSIRRTAWSVLIEAYIYLEPFLDLLATLKSLLDVLTQLRTTPNPSWDPFILQIGLKLFLLNPPAFITTLKLVNDSDAIISSLQLTTYIVHHNPTPLFHHLHNLAERILVAVDPRLGDRRRRSHLPSVIRCLKSLVDTFPNLDFSPGQQLLALGLPEGASVVYDLKSATKVHVVEGFHTSVSAVAVSPEGKYLACFSQAQNLVQVWSLGWSFLEGISSLGWKPEPPLQTNLSDPPDLDANLPSDASVRSNLSQTSTRTSSTAAKGFLGNLFSSSPPQPYRQFHVDFSHKQPNRDLDTPPMSPKSVLDKVQLHFSTERVILLKYKELDWNFKF